jgi:glycine cleavage system H protein
MAAILVVLTILVAVAIDAIVMARHRRAGVAAPVTLPRAMKAPHLPYGVFLDEAHGWVRITGEGTMRVGIDEFLGEALGEVEKVETLPRGAHVERGEPLIRLRVRGRELAVPAPTAGEVVAVNTEINSKPWLVSRDPYGVGWVVGLWNRDHQAAIKPLRIGSAVAGFLHSELVRLSDFLAGRAVPASVPLLADGGVPRWGSLALLDDEAWDAFQKEFLSSSRES